MARKPSDRLAYYRYYPNDFSSDGKVEVMTTEQVGAYQLLLNKAWLETPAGSVPDDDAILAKWARVPPKRWASMKVRVMAPWELRGDGRWYQKRMVEEHAVALDEYRRKSGGAFATNAKRWGEKDAPSSPPLPHPSPPPPSDRLAIAQRPAKRIASDSQSESKPESEPNPSPHTPPGVGWVGDDSNPESAPSSKPTPTKTPHPNGVPAGGDIAGMFAASELAVVRAVSDRHSPMIPPENLGGTFKTGLARIHQAYGPDVLSVALERIIAMREKGKALPRNPWQYFAGHIGDLLSEALQLSAGPRPVAAAPRRAGDVYSRVDGGGDDE